MVKVKATFELENQLAQAGYDFIIGIDEAGRGPLAGPVVAVACVYKKPNKFNVLTQKKTEADLVLTEDDKLLDLIRDSKTLSEKQRESLYDFIQENFLISVGICDQGTIDRMNILQASFLAMKKALSELKIKNKKYQQKNKGQKMLVLVDGNQEIPYLSLEQKAIISGDKISKTIAAASIIAKVTRDRIMRKMHKMYPVYGFDTHKGYGTQKHLMALKKYGPCDIHRKSFRPVKLVLK